MKKVFLCALISLCGICFAQSVSQKAASRRTAERCLKLSENYFLAGDIDSALYQAELGLTYDDSVSDLYYMKAVCRNKLGAAVREVLEISETAREKKNWIGYNEKGNRILLSDLLSDTGKYEEALNELDRTPFVFSADAEAVRIKTYYSEGSESSLPKARDKVNSARRIYKGDERFLNLFFNFEMSFCLLGGRNYIPPKKVLQMADVLSQEMKGMKEVSPQTESISLFFEGFLDSEKQLRGLKAFDAAEKSDYLFPLTCLKSGYWDEAKAFDEFFHFAEKSCTLDVLAYFYSLLESSEILDLFYRTMNAWNGLLYIDLDRDLQWEFDVQYERGRPTSVSYDRNHDGIIDLTCSLDFGELLSAPKP